MTAHDRLEALLEARALLLEIRSGMVPSMTPGAEKRLDDAVEKLDRVIATVTS